MTSKLLGRGFLSLIITQFFGAANDNILKGVLIYMVIDGAWAGRLGPGGQGIVSVCFTVPFIILSGYAGQFADRNSKRYVSVMVKVLEIPISLTGLVGFWLVYVKLISSVRPSVSNSVCSTLSVASTVSVTSQASVPRNVRSSREASSSPLRLFSK